MGTSATFHIGTDVLTFAAYRVRALEQKQRDLTNVGATEKGELATARQRVELLE